MSNQPCPACPATFATSAEMWAHHRDVHEPHVDWPTPPRHRADDVDDD